MMTAELQNYTDQMKQGRNPKITDWRDGCFLLNELHSDVTYIFIKVFISRTKIY